MFLIKFFVLLLLSAFFSGTETALTSLSDYKIRKLYNKYKWFRVPIKLWVYRPYRFIVAILIGNTLVNLLISESSAKMVLETALNISKELKEFLGVDFKEDIISSLDKNYALYLTSEPTDKETPTISFIYEIDDEQEIKEKFLKIGIPSIPLLPMTPFPEEKFLPFPGK